jgi:hypothetical protein
VVCPGSNGNGEGKRRRRFLRQNGAALEAQTA